MSAAKDRSRPAPVLGARTATKMLRRREEHLLRLTQELRALRQLELAVRAILLKPARGDAGWLHTLEFDALRWALSEIEAVRRQQLAQQAKARGRSLDQPAGKAS
jgi:hypothetical protein